MRRRVQFIFQDPYRSLNPRRTVGEAIIEGPMNFGLARKEALQRARDLMAVVHLSPDAIDRYPHQFSGGQRQRICIARALAMEPELLIGDEPVSALDVSVQDQVLKLLDEVRRKFDLAVLFITHDLRVAAQVCDRIAVMQRGVIVEQGTTAEVFAAPRHEYTRALFEAAPGRHPRVFCGRCRAAGAAELRRRRVRGGCAWPPTAGRGLRAAQPVEPKQGGRTSTNGPGRDLIPSPILRRCGAESRRLGWRLRGFEIEKHRVRGGGAEFRRRLLERADQLVMSLGIISRERWRNS